MTSQMEHPKLAEYARKLRWALASLPEVDRDSIVMEMCSHVMDRVDAGASMEAALAALGDPESYARAFRDSYTVTTAISSQRLPQIVSALLHNALRNMAVAAAAAVIFVAWAAAVVVVYLAALKLSDPTHVGLWRGENFFFIGIIDDPSTGQELLGPALPVAALVFILIAWGLTHAVGAWALRRLMPKR